MNTKASSLPSHIAIFMDGNGRWAKSRGLPRSEGHKEGLNTAKRIVKSARDMGIKNLTLYTFSTENWKRAEEEVSFLMGLVGRYLRAEIDFYKENQIRVVHSGDMDRLPDNVKDAIQYVVKETALFKDTRVNLAINYGGRDEILRAIGKLGRLDRKPTEEEFIACMDIPDMPDPDLVIRVGGEYRMSNFLLWQVAYSELYFSPILWPDWTEDNLKLAIEEYQRRDRRFGAEK